jgi:hypothetical protein
MTFSCKWSSVAGSFSGAMLLPPSFCRLQCRQGIRVWVLQLSSPPACSLFKAIMRVLSTPTGTRPTQMHARHAVREYSKYFPGNLPAVPRALRRQTSIGANAGCTNDFISQFMILSMEKSVSGLLAAQRQQRRRRRYTCESRSVAF